MELTAREPDGRWVATPADDDLRRDFADAEFDVDDWEPIAVPGHWRSNPAFADVDDPVLYRTGFDLDATPNGDVRRWWLTFDGLFYQGDVWLDGTYLGDTEGYFFPHTFEITEQATQRSEHILGVEVSCSPQTDRTNKRNITGVFQHWDCIDPEWNPGGIWRPVRVTDTGPVRIARVSARCVEATDARAAVSFTAELDSTGAFDAHLRTTVGSVDHGHDLTVAAGANTVEWTVTIDRPRLWWPHSLGEPHTEPVTVEVRLAPEGAERVAAADGRMSDRRSFRTGLRTVELNRWILSVNGERMFVKGSNQGPTRMAIADATPDDCRRDVDLAVDAGLDLLRIHAHVARPETYEAADAAGLLLWQDFPLQWGYNRHIRKQAVRQATEMATLLSHHPSIAVWCGHNEPWGPSGPSRRRSNKSGERRGPATLAPSTQVPALDLEPDAFADPTRTAQLGIRALAAQQLPTWNKTVLDRSVKRAIRAVDDTRPVNPHSGVMPHLPKLQGTDSHLYFGWYFGRERDLPGFARALPSQVRFPTEFGAQAVPETDDFVDPDAWPDLDWDRLVGRHSLQLSIMDRHVPRDGHTYASWKAATQEYQATLIRRHIETLRRLKYRPTGGFAQFCFADSYPSITWSVLDHERRPKAGYDALLAACAPVIVVADRLPAEVRPGQQFALDVHVVSDRRVPLTGEIGASLSWTGADGRPDGHAWRFGGEVDADACVRVGTLQFEVARDVSDTSRDLVLRLDGRVGEDKVANEYRSTITER